MQNWDKVRATLAPWQAKVATMSVRDVLLVSAAIQGIVNGHISEDSEEMMTDLIHRLGEDGLDEIQKLRIGLDYVHLGTDVVKSIDGLETDKEKDAFLSLLGGALARKHPAVSACHCPDCKKLVDRLNNGPRKEFSTIRNSASWPERMELLGGFRSNVERTRQFAAIMPLSMVQVIATEKFSASLRAFCELKGIAEEVVEKILETLIPAFKEAISLSTEDWADMCFQHASLLFEKVEKEVFGTEAQGQDSAQA